MVVVLVLRIKTPDALIPQKLSRRLRDDTQCRITQKVCQRTQDLGR